MNKELILQIFKAAYNRQSFIDNVLLPTIQGKVDNLKIYDQHGAQEVELTASEEQYAKSAVKYGEFTTRDEIGRTVELYEVILHDHKQVERSRVGIAALIKKQIIGNNAVLVNFAYENPNNRSWRFSFVAHDAVFTDGEMVQSETNPKRYTYVFGEPDETYRTALDRFYTLAHEYEITVDTLKDAFGVEAMSKAFFDEYRDIHYNGFVDYLTRSNFKQSAFNGNEKAIRDFVKKLLGRIVFLYFIQKKGWLGASNGEYKDGDRNFMSNFYKKAGANETFYSTWLSKLFFETLNRQRPNDAFEMPDGSSVKVPYLNGGLFEKESNKYDYLTFPADLFSELFDFFDQYNFTIYEDSPEEHTVAVDPEMLGHIFENLLEDNKDKGAFYTPKEIVHYMTQESLIEYLHTQIPDADRRQLEAFVKNKDNELSDDHKKQIDLKLDAVKICDPAIGSGAFPMGLLQEIFGMKERIAYDLGYSVWSPATVKEHIIQNSIYGVDIEQGAVDIARLRFWLSLIVDEDIPKPLPNLEYKIVVGNSLVSKFEDEIIEIDWSTDSTTGGIFGQELIEGKTKLLKAISAKQKEFFTADNDAKPKLSAEIRKLKLDILAKQLELIIETKGAKRDSNSLSKPSKKQAEKYLETEGWKRTLSKINQLKTNSKPFKHFDWKLDFPETLNPLVATKTGFDIIIANPPYLKERGNAEIFGPVNNSSYGKKWHQGKMDYWFYFLHLAMDNVGRSGVINFITSRYWINNTGATKLISRVQKELSFIDVVDIGKLKVFDNVAGHHMIHIYSKNKRNSFRYRKLKNRVQDIETYTNNENVTIEELNNETAFVNNSEISFTRKNVFSCKSVPLSKFFDVSQGVVEAADKVSAKQHAKIGDPNIQIGSGVFVLTQKEFQKLSLSTHEKRILKEYVDPGQVIKYKIDRSKSKHLIYSDKHVKQQIATDPNFLAIRSHLDKFSDFITSSNRPYGLHRPREVKYFERPKILFKSMFKENEFYLDYDNLYFGMSFSSIIAKEDDQLLSPLLGILNSKLALSWFYNNGKHRGAGVDIGVAKLRSFPLPINFKDNVLSIVVTWINSLQIKETESKSENDLVLSSFLDIADSLVYELYFPGEFQSKDITIEKHAKELFKPIDNLSEEQKIKHIKAAYEELRKKENPLRNQIKLMKIELKDLLLPILSV
jgi:hypothetical protein